MGKLLLLSFLVGNLYADFHNKLYSDVCSTFVHNRRDLQPKGEKARQIRSEIVNRAYVTSQVIKWQMGEDYTFPSLAMIEDEAIIQACTDAMVLEKKQDENTFVFYNAYQRALYEHILAALMKVAKKK